MKQIQVLIRAELEPGTAGLRVRLADHLATLPSCCVISCFLVPQTMIENRKRSGFISDDYFLFFFFFFCSWDGKLKKTF